MRNSFSYKGNVLFLYERLPVTKSATRPERFRDLAVWHDLNTDQSWTGEKPSATIRRPLFDRVAVDLDGDVHDDQDRRDQDREAPEVISEKILKYGKRRLRFGKEHIVRGGFRSCRERIHDNGGDRHTNEHDQRFPDLSCSGLDVTAHSKHNGIEREKDVDRGGVDMHKIENGKLRPRGERKRCQCARNTDHIKEVIQHLIGLEDMYRDHEDILIVQRWNGR